MKWRPVIVELVIDTVIALLLFGPPSCASFGRCVFPAHANLCDATDFDPRCLVGPCRDVVDAGP